MDIENSTYGDRQADTYDAFRDEVFGGEDVLNEVAFLAHLAGPGPALELGVGTGRIALPLASRGVSVTGIDASEAMLERLRSKIVDERVDAVIATMQAFALPDRFTLAYCVSNTFLQLTTRRDQQACLDRVAGHLRPGGAFVVDAWVANPSRFIRNQVVAIWHMDQDSVHLEVSRLNPVTQIVETQQAILRDGEPVRLNPMLQRETTLAELDEDARHAGLLLENRLGEWDGTSYAEGAPRAISVYRLDEG
jgi:ubiquinone/menaquinone biosynthesis C-methylase UbiE